MTRIRTYVSIALVASTTTLAACNTSLCEDHGVSVLIEGNHPTGDHQLAIDASDVSDAVDVTYDIQGDNTGHGHSVTVTADDFVDLSEGKVVTLTSSDTGAVGNDHTHGIVLECKP